MSRIKQRRIHWSHADSSLERGAEANFDVRKVLDTDNREGNMQTID